MFSFDQDRPAWYRLHFDDTDHSVCVTVSPKTANFVRSFINSCPTLIKRFDQITCHDEFANNDIGPWGFGETCICTEHESCTVWRCRLPAVYSNMDDGEALLSNWAASVTAAATLSILFNALNSANELGGLPHLQVAMMEITVHEDPREFPIFIALSPVATKWTEIDLSHPLHLEKVSHAMEVACEHMCKRRRPKERCLAYVYGRRKLELIFPAVHDCSLSTCPESNGCSLELSPRNILTPLQQMTLLAGAAELCSLIGQELWPKT